MLTLLQHLLLPHDTNNHRARALHLDSLFYYAIALVFFHWAIGFFHQQYPDILGYATDIHVEQLFQATNAKRVALGLPPLSLNERLSQAAAAKAEDMFAKNYWAHNDPDGKSPWDFIVAAGYKYTVAGENLAKNFSNSQGVIDAWMTSASHRDNILKSTYRDIGFAVVNGALGGEETTLVVQMFGAGSSPVSFLPQPVVKEVSAQTPPGTVARLPTPTPIAVPSPQSKLEPVVITEQSSMTAGSRTSPPVWGIPGFADVFKKPLIDIPQASRSLVLLFIGFLLGVLVVDGWLASKRRIVRVAGHNTAHIVFLGALLLSAGALGPGSIL